MNLPPSGTAGSRFKREVLVFFAFSLFTVLMTWPWARIIKDGVPDGGDPYLNAWILWRCFHGFFTDPLNLFHGNIFFPYRYSLAFSEHNFGLAFPLFPLFALGLRPLTAHSIVMLLGFALSGYGAFRLTRTLSGSAGAGWISGIGFAFVLYRFHHLSHVNYVFSAWMPLTLEAAILFTRERSWRKSAWLGVSFLMLGLSCIHWFVLSAIPLLLTGLISAWKEDALRDRDLFTRGGISLGASSLLLAPFFWPYLKVGQLYGLARSEEEAAGFSAKLVHWFTSDPRSWAWSGLGATPPPGELCLFPGMLLLMLPFVAVLCLKRLPGFALGVGCLWTSAGFFGSLGMNFPFHRLLFRWVPLFRGIRVPARWAMVADLGLAILAGLGALALCDVLDRRWPGHRFLRPTVLSLLGALLLLDLRVAPLALIHGRVDSDPVSDYLAKEPMHGGIAVLPVSDGKGPYLSVLRAADHQKPLISAVSGFGLPIPAKIESLASERPIPATLLDHLESIPASYLIVRRWRMAYDDPPAHLLFLGAALKAQRLRFVGSFGNAREREDLFAVTKTEPDARTLEAIPREYLDPPPAAEVAKASRVLLKDASLMGSLDNPANGEVIRGDLLVRGWARSPGEDLEVMISINGSMRTPKSSVRVPRDDVHAAIPGLGDCSKAGFEVRYEFMPVDEGKNEIRVYFVSSDGRTRPYPAATFEWKSGSDATAKP